MRIQYQCICDKCKNEIEKKEDEHEIVFSSNQYQLCSSCHTNACALLLNWTNGWESPLKKEQVIRGTPGESSAELLGFELIDNDQAFVDITVSSRVRQVGRTSIANIILQALAKVGYRNLHMFADDSSLNCIPPGFAENKTPDLRINIFDKASRFC